MTYEFKTKPFAHQQEIFDKHKDRASFALFWEQGTGKTKPVIDNVAYLYEADEVNGLLIVAPNGVHRNWITDEIPAHMPDRLRSDVRTHIWQSKRASTNWHAKAVKDIINHKGLAVLAIGYEGFMTKAGKKAVWAFLKKRRCLFALDEAHNIKTPGAKRTMSIIAAGKHAPFRRLMTGTPIAQGPFDIYSQARWVKPSFWADRGLFKFHHFKRRYGVWRTAEEVMREDGYDPGFDQLLEYKNIDDLHDLLRWVGSRKTKDEVLDLPPKLYSKRYITLTTEQQRIYDDLVNTFEAELESGSIVEAPLAIVRLLRLQQVICGYVAAEADEPIEMIPGKNPRLDELLEITEGLGHKAIIWGRFRKDIDLIMEALGDKAVRYDGKVDELDRAQAKEDFQKGDAQFFVANPAAGATGLTLTAARTVIYYSNSFKMVDRLQSEDRAHRIGQEHPVSYIDLVAPDTIDEHIVRALRSKFDIATQITGDRVKEWI